MVQLVQDRIQWRARALSNTVMVLRLPKKTVNLLTN